MLVYDVCPVGYAACVNILGAVPQGQTLRDAVHIHLGVLLKQRVANGFAALGDIFYAMDFRLG